MIVIAEGFPHCLDVGVRQKTQGYLQGFRQEQSKGWSPEAGFKAHFRLYNVGDNFSTLGWGCGVVSCIKKSGAHGRDLTEELPPAR